MSSSRNDARKARAIRRRCAREWSIAAQQGHPGGDMSVTDILATLYFGVLRVDPNSPNAPDARPLHPEQGPLHRRALRDAGREAGFIPVEHARHLHAAAVAAQRPSQPQLRARRRDQHRPARPRPAGRRRHRHRRPDRQCRLTASSSSPATASCRKAATGRPRMTAGHRKLANLTLIVDRNRLQQGARVEDTTRSSRSPTSGAPLAGRSSRSTATTTTPLLDGFAPRAGRGQSRSASSPTPSRAGRLVHGRPGGVASRRAQPGAVRTGHAGDWRHERRRPRVAGRLRLPRCVRRTARGAGRDATSASSTVVNDSVGSCKLVDFQQALAGAD